MDPSDLLDVDFQSFHLATVAEPAVDLPLKVEGGCGNLQRYAVGIYGGQPSQYTQYIGVFCRYLLSIAVSSILNVVFSLDWRFQQHWASGSCRFGCPGAMMQG